MPDITWKEVWLRAYCAALQGSSADPNKTLLDTEWFAKSSARDAVYNFKQICMEQDK